MNSIKKGVFLNTRSKKNLKQNDKDIEKCIRAVHMCQHEDAKGLLNIDTELYKTHEDRSSIAFALMILGGDLFKKDEIKEGSLAYFKAYQIDPENPTVEKIRIYCEKLRE